MLLGWQQQQKQQQDPWSPMKERPWKPKHLAHSSAEWTGRQQATGRPLMGTRWVVVLGV